MMKKILSLLIALLACITTFAAEKTVWEGSQQISWNTDYFPGSQLDTSEADDMKTIFTGLAKDDIVRLYTTTEYDSPQYALKYKTGANWDWTDLEFTNTSGVLSFTVSSDDMATWIVGRGLVITGQAYTLTKITIETPSGEEESAETDLSVQDGSSALPLILLSDWSAYTTFAASQFTNAKAGDVITVYVQNVEEGAQISLKDMSDGWPALDESTQYPSVATADTKFVYTLTEESVAKVKAYGLVIGGQKLTVTRVTLTTTSSVDPEPEPTEGVTYTAWQGETVFGNTWSVWQEVAASAFANAKENMILRVKFKDLKAGAQLQMSDGSWTVLPEVEVVNISGVYQDYTITAGRLAVLQEKGLIISGTSFTLTSVEVINPADLKPLTLSVPVTNNWVYSSAPSFTIHAENPYNEVVTANAVIAIATDKLAPVTTITKSVDIAANGTEDIMMTCTESLAAGIYHATATVNDDMARSFFFAVNPTDIVSALDSQSDFNSYWTAAREQLTAVEATDEPILTEIPSKSTEKRKVYLVEFKSIPDGTNGEPVTVRGYYAEPTDGLRHPVIMHYLGYDSGYRPGGQDVKPYCPSGDGDTSDYAEFYLSARGQSINNRAADEREADGKGDFTNTYGDWFAFNFGQKDSYYYRGAYMDQVRAIDFMATRKTSDMDNLFAEGQSQGGAFTVAAAALSGYTFKAIAPAITFMGDFPDYFDIVNWPAYVARENQGTMTDAEMFAFLSYYDTKNLATKISCPVITSIGLQDNVCPAHTNLAPYNNVTTAADDKQIVYNPELQHQVANDWFTTYMTFFKKYQTESQQDPEPEPEPATPVFNEDGVADLSKMEVQNAEKVTYDSETHTVTTTEGWTGVQLTVSDGEEVSGKELRVTFDREMAVKCYVKYMDETDADVIMDKAEQILYFTLDETKKLYQVQIQPTEAATFAFQEIKVNQESTQPEPEPEPGEKTRTENAQKLFDVLTSLFGNKIISGTTAVVDWNTSQAEQVHQWTNQYPAINTYDFINIHASKDVNPDGWLDYSDISGVKNWAAEGGVVSAMWHWQVKNNAGTGYTCSPGTGDAATSFDASKVYVDGTAENTLAKQQLSQVCGYLKKMQDAGIPVIWRPFHEAAGNTYEFDGGTAWFWWGAQGADVYKQLWQWMYNYMVNEQGLHNLIWVWTSQTKDDSWYPGNDYVDIIGRDSYGGQAAQQKSDFDHLTAAYPNMMTALSECGNTSAASQSDISAVWETGAKWSWFSTWYDSAGSQLHNTQDWWTNAFSQDYVVTRDQMKELLDLNIEPEPEPQPELKPLEEGETRTLFEDAEGVVMTWNEICQMDAEWGAILEAGESFLVTVKSRTEGSEWPKVILRDANSEGIIEVGLYEVSSYPYIVKTLLTDEVVAKLRNGFRFSGDGITITKIELTKPAPAKEGDVNIEAMNWFRDAIYDSDIHQMTTTARWGQAGWQIDDDRYADKTLVIVNIEETTFPVTLKMEYTNTNGSRLATSVGIAPGKTQLNLPLPLDTKVINKVYLTYSESASIVLTDAAVITAANARPLTGEEIITGIEEIANGHQLNANSQYYDLQGRQVSQPVKGLYIVNGKKAVFK